MTNHDPAKELAAAKQLVEKISPKFSELAVDVTEVMKQANDPVMIAALLFKLTEEREKTNRLLESINSKFDDIMFRMKTSERTETAALATAEILPENDKAIMDFISKNGKATAGDIMIAQHYKGMNGASQRLNKLCKENYLVKVRSGKKVLYLIKS